MTVLSNGRLMEERAEADGKKSVRWLQEQPHANYLICLVAGNLRKLENQHGDIPLGFYTQPSLFPYAENSFRDTADIMAFYETEIGVPFPWNKYDQVTILDFVAGGMENTTLTTLTANTIFASETENIRSSRRLDAHEMAHQWFGDLVTCKDWSHLWLNEGFATYYTLLHEGHKFGQEELLYGLFRDAKTVLSRQDDKRPIVYRRYKNAGEQFDYRSYPKGAWVLHMLRCQLTPELFRECVRQYLQRYALQSVVTDDFRQILEEYSGRPWDRFFDQWVYHAGCPQLKVQYAWLPEDHMAKVTVQQTQTVDQDVLLFHFPTRLRFYVNDRVVDHEIVIRQTHEDFYVPLPAQPAGVRFDPDYTVLAQIEFPKSDDMLVAQLQRQGDVIGRLLAAEALAERSNQRAVAALTTSLQEDAYYGVRKAASTALRKIHTDEAFAALSASLEQPDARVRLQVVEDLADFYRPAALEQLAHVLAVEANPAIQAAAIRALGKYHGEVPHRLITRHLERESFRNELANAAIDAIGQQRNARYCRVLMDTIKEREADFTANGLNDALMTLAEISRNHRRQGEVRQMLLGYVNHPRQTIQIGAVRALGALGDRRAAAVLETLVIQDGPDSRLTSAARASLQKLQDESRFAPREVSLLRKEVTELKQQNEQLQRQLTDLTTRVEAQSQSEQPAISSSTTTP
jgi:aminopeptidase N